MSTCSAVPPTAFATAARSSPWAGTSAQITCAPSRASTSAIAAPMPREAPVTSAVAGQRPLPVDRPLRRRRADPDDLAGTYAERPESRKRSVDSRSAPGSRLHQLGGGPLADLLAGRAHEALECALGDALAGADDDQPATRSRAGGSRRWKKP